ncbi:MAG: GNAT family N-acetyltransferase [Thalassospira sp.]|uniref:GNAT family N-acetyltransferase n=1 Tax=Thalassospira sp. TaxID=1912094 RepID=UPI0032EC0711
MTIPPVATSRLNLSPPTLSDIPDLYAFLGDRDAMHHTHHDESFATCRKRVLVHEWRRRHDGFAPWVVRRAEQQDIIGWGGLYIDPFDQGWGPELGYYFHPKAWGQGYASELARAAIDFANDFTAIETLSAFAHPENSPSRKLLLRHGFKHVDFVPAMNRDRFGLSLHRG